mmetsp:Transcript_12425/g.39181  ORF Transcript_12425/g.39181 Transcript_12425/m.39181 type:complete len:98 (-) Transcript_12425:192-485(-)|eukprot:CAMPEP_0204532772 /NCGR_PEP_ID=MMETSP0661-20131031/11908_1 /ASSEMBLY_ACC=CAM_ASM_000606 /TAXON_ID=109239 /ORGANISM="Alexandrium margalefi, Strain AMGDE01CS-322" /LENGTH=97 /DNA_ID=CAMNT_0051539041 /DNA_START=153 /DNA_END=446 /DNA_ORIENTATION=-
MTPASEPQSPPGSPTNDVVRAASKHSIITGKSGRESRMDSFGTVIEKGKKKHRCSFPDEQDPKKPVSEKIEVTAYKNSGTGDWNSLDNQPGCSCNVM